MQRRSRRTSPIVPCPSNLIIPLRPVRSTPQHAPPGNRQLNDKRISALGSTDGGQPGREPTMGVAGLMPDVGAEMCYAAVILQR